MENNDEMYSIIPTAVKGDSSTKKKNRDDENGNDTKDIQNKKTTRFVWPEALHKQFISAVFDVGLKFASSKEVASVAPSLDSVSPDQMKSCIQKFRSFRRSDSDSQNKDVSVHSNHQSSLSMGDTGTERKFNGRAKPEVKQADDAPNFYGDVWHESDYYSSDLPPAEGTSAAGRDIPVLSEQEEAVVNSLSAEIELIGSKIAAQTRAVMEMEGAIVQQMRIYSSLVDTLTQIDPSITPTFSQSLSCCRDPASTQVYGSQSPHGITSTFPQQAQPHDLQQMYIQQHRQQQQFPFYVQQQPFPTLRHCKSHESLCNSVDSDAVVTSMKTATTSPAVAADSSDQQTTHGDSPASSEGVEGDLQDRQGGRTELHAMHEMRAQMDLHRRLFEWKEDQVSGFKAVPGDAGLLFGHPLYRHSSAADLQRMPFPLAYSQAMAPPFRLPSAQPPHQILSLADSASSAVLLRNAYHSQYLPPMHFMHNRPMGGSSAPLREPQSIKAQHSGSLSSSQAAPESVAMDLSNTGLSDHSLSTLNDAVRHTAPLAAASSYQQVNCHNHQPGQIVSSFASSSSVQQPAVAADAPLTAEDAAAAWDDSLDFEADLFSFLEEGDGDGAAV